MSRVITITGLAFGGRGVGRINGKAVFVPYAAPGDEAEVEIVSEKKGYSEAVITGLLKSSAGRAEPLCRYYGLCGGCSWQHLSYETQAAWKQRILGDALERIGGIKDVAFDEPALSRSPFHYRGRARLHSRGGRMGFYEAGSRRLVDVDECPLLEPPVNEAFRELRKALNGKAPFDEVEIAAGADGKTAAAFHVRGRPDNGFIKTIGRAAVIAGFEIINAANGRRVWSQGETLLAGGVMGMAIAAGVSGFSQVNRAQNEVMAAKAVEYAGLTGAERVLDLYCGAGNLSLPLALRAGRVTGVEADREAVKQAGRNAGLNNIVNAAFHASDAAGWLRRGARPFKNEDKEIRENVKILERGGPDVVILDPPRDGEGGAARLLGESRIPRIVYVSCNPPALARDARLLARSGYRLSRAGLIDMFPQTYHIESIARFDLA
ncbi:MAG: class I SAM-dependent RNA methyltransferase [Deltaproteobacteria bacterium]|nr:class I SAM-dependent RNA methyltransferase [Deltaproteobacteria bacterium]